MVLYSFAVEADHQSKVTQLASLISCGLIHKKVVFYMHFTNSCLLYSYVIICREIAHSCESLCFILTFHFLYVLMLLT